MQKRLCACGCGERVTRKFEAQHINALAPALLTSQVLDQNRRLIRRKKRSQAIGFPAPLRQRLAMGNTTQIDDMDLDQEVYGQSRSSHLQRIAPHAGPSGLTHGDSFLLDPSHNCEDFFMDYSAPSRPPLSNDDDPIFHDYLEEAYGQSKLHHSGQIAPHAGHQPHAGRRPSSLIHDHNDISMDYPALSISPLPNDDAGMHMGKNLDGEVYGLSNLRRSRRIADGVKKIGQQRWGVKCSCALCG